MTQVPIPGAGIQLGSSNKNSYGRSPEHIQIGMQGVAHKRLVPLKDQGVESVFLDKIYGRYTPGGIVAYPAFKNGIDAPDTRHGRDIVESIEVVDYLSTIFDVYIYLGSLDSTEMLDLDQHEFLKQAIQPLEPHLNNPRVFFVFDLSNGNKITKDSRTFKFLAWLDQRIGSHRVIREALPSNPDQYGVSSMLNINAYRQFTNRPPEALAGPIHLFYADLRKVGTIPIPGKTGTEYASLAWWGWYCFVNGYKFSVAEHVMRSLGMTYGGLRDEIQGLVDLEEVK